MRGLKHWIRNYVRKALTGCQSVRLGGRDSAICTALSIMLSPTGLSLVKLNERKGGFNSVVWVACARLATMLHQVSLTARMSAINTTSGLAQNISRFGIEK